MKKLLKPVLLTAFIISSVSANSQTLKWAKLIGSVKEEYSLNHLKDTAGNMYISGKTTGSISGENAGFNDGFLMKLDKAGKIIWKKQFGSGQEEDVQWSAIDNSGNVYLTGFTTGSLFGKNVGKEDIFIVKFNPEGEQEWQKQVGTDSTDIAKGICTDRNGFVYLTGATNGVLGKNSFGKSDCFIMKIDGKGKIVTTRQFGTSQDDNGYSVTTGANDNLFFCGTTWGDMEGKNAGFIDAFTGHLTNDLEPVNFKQFGSDGFDMALVVHADSENNLYVGGSTSGNFGGTQSGDGDCFLLKQNEKGDIIWNKQFGTEHHDGVRGIEINEDILVSGVMNLPPEKAFVRIYDRNGNMTWEKTFETDGQGGGTSGKDVVADRDGFTLLGLTGSGIFGPVIGEHDIYLLKFSRK